MTYHAKIAAVLAAVGLALAGCGSDDKQSTTGADASTATQTQQAETARAATANTTLQLPAEPDAGTATKDPTDGRTKVLDALPKVKKADEDALAPKIKGSEGMTVAEFLGVVANDVGAYWQGQFNESGYEFPAVDVHIITTEQPTRCDEQPLQADTKNAFYCPPDPALLLPVGFFETELNQVGDAAIAIAVAHEWGHRVQHLLGFLDANAQGRLTGRQIEMQADCLGGVWMSTVYARGLLEEGDLEEAIKLTSAVGDALDTPAEQQHGTAEERVAAFKKGFEAGHANQCDPSQFAGTGPSDAPAGDDPAAATGIEPAPATTTP